MTMVKGPAVERINDWIELRAVTPEDREFLLKVYECAREIELSMVPWEAAMKRAFVEHQFDAQTNYYSEQYPSARHGVIVLSGSRERVGRLYVNRTVDQISILDITVLADYRRRGIGSAIIDALVGEAGRFGSSVQVYVETFNPSREFFARRHFEVQSNDGVNLRLIRSTKVAE